MVCVEGGAVTVVRREGGPPSPPCAGNVRQGRAIRCTGGDASCRDACTPPSNRGDWTCRTDFPVLKGGKCCEAVARTDDYVRAATRREEGGTVSDGVLASSTTRREEL